MENQDFHRDCFHCREGVEPVWPVEDLESWKLEVCEMEAKIEYNHRDYEDNKRFKREVRPDVKKAIEEAQKESEVEQITKIIQEVGRQESPIKNEEESKMNKKNAEGLTRTGLVDKLLLVDLSGSYSDGSVDRIVAEVQRDFSGVPLARLRSLVFVRRSTLKAKSTATAAA